MNYGIVINCIDVTNRLPVIEFLKFVWKTEWVVVISDAAPEKVLSERKDTQAIEHIHKTIQASLKNREKVHLAVVSHHGCFINKDGEFEKRDMLHKAVEYLKSKYSEAEVMGIWVDKEGKPMNLEYTVAGEKSVR